MKKHSLLIFAAVITAVLLAAACGPATPKPPAAKATVTGIFVTDSMKDDLPGPAGTAFPAFTKTLYIPCRVVPAANENVTVDCKLVLAIDPYGAPVNGLVAAQTTTTTTPRNIVFAFDKPGFEWKRGQYRAFIFLDGKEAGTADFRLRYSMDDAAIGPGNEPIVRVFLFVPGAITAGQASALFWFIEDADNVTITGIGPADTQGFLVMAPSSYREYKLSASNPDGTATATANITVKAPPASGKPDLVISGFSNDGKNVSCSVKNVGDAPAGAFEVYLSMRGAEKAGTAACEGLLPGQEKTLNFEYKWTQKEHKWDIPYVITVDGGKGVDESAEDNNTLMLIW